MKRIKVIAALLLAFISLPTAAQAFDIPLLTWERGRTQQVVLGGGATSTQFKVQLEGNGITPMQFAASTVSKAGYVVYTVNIPSDLPLGAYSISTSGPGSPSTVVAGVAIVQAATKTAASSLFDLTRIITILVFLTGLISTLRSRKYSMLSFASTQELPVEEFSENTEPFAVRLSKAPERIRVRTIMSFQQSLLRYLTIREGELTHRMNRSLYGALPFVALVVGAIAGIETIRNNGLAHTGLAIFIAVALISILDSFSGIFAVAAFWATQLFTGNITSVRDILIALSIALSWIGTSLFASVVRESSQNDLASLRVKALPAAYLATLFSAAIGTIVFYWSQNLVDSIIYIESPERRISWVALEVIAIALVIRGAADISFMKNSSQEQHSEDFYVARVSSPRTAFAIHAVLFAFIYIWTESSQKALLVSTLFSLPYYLVFIQFDSKISLAKLKLQRNLLLEPLVVAALALVAFRQISLQPLLSDQRTQILLIASAIPVILHAIYCAICSSDEKKAIINP